MADLPISVCFWNYDRTMPIADGRVPVAGCETACELRRPEDAFHRAFHGGAPYDVTELSFSRYLGHVARGDEVAYAAIPVFPSRAFRHGAIFVRADRGIETPADLKGRTLGLLDFDMTAALAVRGMLLDDHGVRAADIAWVVGDVERAERETIPLPADPPPGLSVTAAPKGATLNGLLDDGALDGIVGLYEPGCMRAGAPVRRLFADWRAAEQDYYARTGIFPIMHTVGIRRTLLADHPWLARAVFDAFCAARDMAVAELRVPQACKVTLPWVTAEHAATVALMGEDFWPYGMQANRAAVDAAIRWALAEGSLPRAPALDELFVPEMLES